MTEKRESRIIAINCAIILGGCMMCAVTFGVDLVFSLTFATIGRAITKSFMEGRPD